MNKKTYLQFLVAFAILSTPVLYQNCSPSHGEGSGDLLSSGAFRGSTACDPILIQGYEGYRNALAAGNLCLNCHTAGGPAGKPFADPNMDVAYQSLLDEGEDKIWTFALNPAHKAGFTGPQNEAILAPHRETFQAAESQYSACIADSGQNSSIPANGLPTPTVKSANLILPDAAQILDNPQVLTFNVNGYTVTLQVSAWETDLGNRGYDFSLPSVTAGAQALYLKNMGIYLNDAMIPAPAGTAFQNVDRYLAAGTTRALYRSGVMNVTYNTLATNSIAVAFEAIQAAPNMNFTPATYEDLVNGPFAVSCSGCHNGANPSGGISLADGSYTLNHLQGIFTPFDTNSQLLQSIELGRMPGVPAMSAADIALVRGWLMDGAPVGGTPFVPFNISAAEPSYSHQMNVNLGNNPTTVTLRLLVFDPDNIEGELRINGNGPISLFPNNNNDNMEVEVLINVPVNFMVNGLNTFDFTYVATAGFSVNAMSVTVQ